MKKFPLATIVINYKMEELTCSFVREELSKCKLDNLVVIVDNGATEESSLKMSELLNAPIVRDINAEIDENCRCFIIFNKENTGFARGNNLGVEFVHRHFECKYLLFSNNDIRLKDPDVVEQLISKLEILPDVGVIGPKVVGIDGHCQSPSKFYSFSQRMILYDLQRIVPFFKGNWLDQDKATEGYYYRVMGSFMLCRTTDFGNCGMFDPNTFLYAEEQILSERLLKLGKLVYYYPDVTVIHEHGATVKKINGEMSQKDYSFESLCYYYMTYKNIGEFSIFLVRCLHGVILYLNTVRKVAYQMASFLRKGKRKAYISAYLFLTTFSKNVLSKFSNKKSRQIISVNTTVWPVLKGLRPIYAGNYGDALNFYLIPKVFGKTAVHYRYDIWNRFLGNENILFIGSIILGLCNSKSIIIGAGISPDQTSDKFAHPKKIYSVRGPKTRSFLMEMNIPCPEIYGDPAILMPLFYNPKSNTKKYKIGFVLHYLDRTDSVMRTLAKYSHDNIVIIDIQNYPSFEAFIDCLCSCEMIMSSSLHGLILADAYNIPNVWTHFEFPCNPFKYQDYLESVCRVEKDPYDLSTPVNIDTLRSFAKTWKPIQFDKIGYLEYIQSCLHEDSLSYK